MPVATSVPSRPLILQPRSVPVIGRDGHLPALSAVQLTAEAVRLRLQSGGAYPVPIAGDGGGVDQAGRMPAPAAVLVGLVSRAQGLSVLLTRRTEHLKHHAGQISFPGGRQEPGDADETAAALREAQEEIGLLPECVEVLGRMPVYTTVTKFMVTPVVALIPPDVALQPQPSEVAEIFEVPLAFLMNPASHHRHRFEANGVQREFLSMPWSSPEGREYFIWGATAAMLRNFYHLLAGSP
jgi:8-oxo-dGTP pyrophosphatase MutT (NUDIX family)